MADKIEEDRQLLAILVADIVGYSKLMRLDERKTFANLRVLREAVIEPVIHTSGGSIEKWTGDGFIGSFPSTSDAVRAAARIQAGVIARLAPTIVLRIGINSGDVILTRDDVFGDTVNVAARLQSCAEPGGILVSRGVRDAVRDGPDLTFEAAGTPMFKNIVDPIETYRVRFDPAAFREVVVPSGSRGWRDGPPFVWAAGAGLAAIALVGVGYEGWTRNGAAGGGSDLEVATAKGGGTGSPRAVALTTAMGQPVRVARAWSVDPRDCAARRIGFQVMQEPRHGHFETGVNMVPIDKGKCRTAAALDVTYIPDSGFNGSDTSTFRLRDAGQINDQTVAIVVRP
ncbi:adenylate/guanylate cyclase domain-containing protein [Methylobacterium sp. J-067]|uniref:adenylate/guanylate cyclase domain-containing protein n=1 Tax=Methylobacterium sp. J-067 TaxID=2836648 RepID=UPI001FBAE9DB|nr:adenylate/guanylate cyclase domain-containing protein [Methylobacterium sp. J-067]MCJ2025148.1 adenylate/guanylate cyclase domain-containing protein [Methylobacterium sp. J-067]